MTPLKLSKEDFAALKAPLKAHLNDHYDCELSLFQTEMLLEFLVELLGPKLYNLGVSEAQKYMLDKADDLYGLLK